ncbi:class I SAM-dependent methyltransferase [Akkermansiaceae bacterium]|jgi:SAM-dependent methyltransferase|nr:class I SAM-dependent methyltransferase [Akkermansiaceae bacterium]MDA7929445.1 class I SAM-dependent methyltransferase [Akkermansiaceae bacterium]MDB4370439.1 class I SAM-dependent methyltransferase [Akkermansiaceae bacterium]MDB4465652.1 class I SAM-dependent methyltransferase [Akkermansiaceae bacterium]MDF1711717.1 class I SAM-dependent methyltransferase [Akkermansiaceae bacterium]
MKKLPLIAILIVAASLIYWTFTRIPPESKKSGEPEVEIEDSSEYWESVTSVEQTPSYQPPPPEHNFYSDGPKTRDGIGKYYQGREIAYVMGHPAIQWLERPEREKEEAPTKALDLIKLAPGEVLADIGAGSGYYSLRIAMTHPNSRVVSVDIQPEMIDFLKGRTEKLGIANVSPHLGKIDGIGLPDESIDAALMIDAYHEFSHPYEMMKSIASALRPGGRVYLLEYREEDPDVPIKPLHKMSQEQAKKEMTLVGLEWDTTIDDLPWQHFMVFKKP